MDKSFANYPGHSWRVLFEGLLLAALLGLAACAEMPQGAKTGGVAKESAPIPFPPAPETARFFYEWTIRGSADVASGPTESTLKQWVAGVDPINNIPLSKPFGVAVNRGRVFVSDSVSRVIHVFDIPAGRHFLIGEDDPGRLAKPLGISADAAGNLYVADATAKVVMVYDRDGRFLRTLAGPSYFDRLASVTVDKQGERIYAVDIGGVESQNHRVRVFDAHSGDHLFDIGKRGKGPGEFNLPSDVVAGKDDTLFVLDSGNFRVQAFDAAGKYLREFGHVGKRMGDFARPRGMAVDAEGNLYVTDGMFGNFQIFTPEGQLLLFIGEHSEQGGPARYMLPAGIAVDEDGRVYMVDQWFRKVEVFRPAALGEHDGYLAKQADSAAKK